MGHGGLPGTRAIPSSIAAIGGVSGATHHARTRPGIPEPRLARGAIHIIPAQHQELETPESPAARSSKDA